MNKFSVILIIFLFSAFTLKSQEKSKKDSIIDRGDYPKVLVKIAPLATIDFTEISIQPSIEVQFRDQIAWQGEINIYLPSVVTSSGNTSNNPYAGEYHTGYKIKNQIRFYMNDEYSENNSYLGTYYAIEHFYKVIDTHFSSLADSKTGNYQRVFDMKTRKEVNAFHLVIGQHSMVSKKLPFGFDLYAGLGIRSKNISMVDDVSEGYIYDPGISLWNNKKEGKSLLPSITLGFRITYLL